METFCEPTADGKAALNLLAPVNRAWGDNYLLTPLEHCHQILDRFTGDRVVALFGTETSPPNRRCSPRSPR